MERLLCDDEITRALVCLVANVEINEYALENYVFGRIMPDEKIPVENYINDLGLPMIWDIFTVDVIDGWAIENGKMISLGFDNACFEIFKEKVEYMFHDVPTDEESERSDDDIAHYENGLYEYLKNLYAQFRAIMEIEVEQDEIHVNTEMLDNGERGRYYLRVSELVKSVLLKNCGTVIASIGT